MKVSELIELLSKLDQNKQVMIQQGEDYDYVVAYSVKEMELVDADSDDDEPTDCIVIEYV